MRCLPVEYFFLHTVGYSTAKIRSFFPEQSARSEQSLKYIQIMLLLNKWENSHK